MQALLDLWGKNIMCHCQQLFVVEMQFIKELLPMIQSVEKLKLQLILEDLNNDLIEVRFWIHNNSTNSSKYPPTSLSIPTKEENLLIQNGLIYLY